MWMNEYESFCKKIGKTRDIKGDKISALIYDDEYREYVNLPKKKRDEFINLLKRKYNLINRKVKISSIID